FNGEVAQAAAALDRDRTEDIVQRAYEKYIDELDKKPYGNPFPEVYDVKTVQRRKNGPNFIRKCKMR
ncbi:MAG: monomethylamine:corrinoid methyltransferase, partial [Anaerolineales bacterium]